MINYGLRELVSPDVRANVEGKGKERHGKDVKGKL